MKNILLNLREAESTMRGTIFSISHYISENPNTAVHMTARELADATYTSPSSVIRFCREIGFNGYYEFRQQLLLELAVLHMENTQQTKTLDPDASVGNIMRCVIERDIACLKNTESSLEEKILSECADRIDSAKRILLFGVGASLCVAKDAYLKFLRINKDCITNDDWHSQLLQAKNATSEDVAILFSYSGQTEEMIRCMHVLQENGTPVIAITGLNPSPIKKEADYVLTVASIEPVFRNGASSSRIGQLCVMDILYEIMINRHYDSYVPQLAKTHIKK